MRVCFAPRGFLGAERLSGIIIDPIINSGVFKGLVEYSRDYLFFLPTQHVHISYLGGHDRSVSPTETRHKKYKR